ncbi:MAG: YfhO family protein [Conexibacter sp.]
MVSRSRWGSRAAARPEVPGGTRRAALSDTRVIRALAAHEHRSAALLLALVVLAYLWPVLLAGRVLTPTALLYAETMWHAVAPAGVERWINPDLGDVVYGYYPWDVLARELIHAGTFPAWNPHAFGGTPLWANSQVAWLSPFSLPLWILPLNYGLGVAAALKLWCAGFGTYLLGRELRLGFWPAILAGVAFALCSFNVVWLSYGVFVSVSAVLPWTLWLIERIVRRGHAIDGAWLAAIVGIAFTGGHPGTQVHLVGAAALYVLVRTATHGGVGPRERGVRLTVIGAAIVLGVALAAVVLLPAELASHQTVGADAREHGAAIFPSSHMPAGVARSVLFPEWWGRPSEGVSLGPQTAFYRERTFYAGAITVALALLALLTPGAWRRKAPFAALAVLGLAIALRTPGLYDAVVRLPGFDRVQNARIQLWFQLAFSVLAAFGLQSVLDARGRIGRAWIAPAAILLAAVAAIAAVGPSAGAWPNAFEHMLSRGRTSVADTLGLASALWVLAFAAILIGLVVCLRRRPSQRAPIAMLIALVVTLDLLHAAHGYQPMPPAATAVPPRTQAIAFLQRHRDAGRMTGIEMVGADWTTVYGLHDVVGFDAPQPTFRQGRILQMTIPSPEASGGGLPFDPRSQRILGMLGVRYLLFPPGVNASIDGLTPAYEGSEATIFENQAAAPRAFVPSTVRPVTGAREEFATIEEASFDPRREATARLDEIDGRPPPTHGRGSAHVVTDTDASVTMSTTLAHRGLVVLGDTWGPGWSVKVDGRPSQALQANAVLRGVIAPAGTHEIVWRYRVPGLRLGAAVSGAALIALVAWAALAIAGPRRRSHGRPRAV